MPRMSPLRGGVEWGGRLIPPMRVPLHLETVVDLRPSEFENIFGLQTGRNIFRSGGASGRVPLGEGGPWGAHPPDAADQLTPDRQAACRRAK